MNIDINKFADLFKINVRPLGMNYLVLGEVFNVARTIDGKRVVMDCPQNRCWFA